MDSGMGAGTNVRLQVSLAILTGVLVIVVTTVVVIMMGRAKSNADNLDAFAGPLPTLPSLGVPTLTPRPGATTPAAEGSPSKKATKSTSPTTAPWQLALACEAHDMAVSASMNCTVSITPAASSMLTVTLDASTPDIALPGSVSILAGQSFSDPFLISGQASSGGSTTLTAKAIGLTTGFSVTVTAT